MLNTLAGRGWTLVRPPEPGDDDSVIARYNGEPIRAGIEIETYRNTNSELHTCYRSGEYNVELKVDFDVLRATVNVTRVNESNDEDE